MVRVLHHERPGRRTRRLVLRHLLDVSECARRVGHHSIAQVWNGVEGGGVKGRGRDGRGGGEARGVEEGMDWNGME